MNKFNFAYKNLDNSNYVQFYILNNKVEYLL